MMTASPPMRGRGLKHQVQGGDYHRDWSPPMRGRGLKPAVLELVSNGGVAPHAGAWIETQKRPSGNPTSCRPPCGGVD